MKGHLDQAHDVGIPRHCRSVIVVHSCFSCSVIPFHECVDVCVCVCVCVCYDACNDCVWISRFLGTFTSPLGEGHIFQRAINSTTCSTAMLMAVDLRDNGAI